MLCLRLLALLLFFVTSLSAYDLCDFEEDLSQLRLDIDLSNGYRQDRLITLVHIFVPSEIRVATDHLKARTISLYQVGLRGDWTVCQWLLRMEGDYATGGKHGKYREKSAGIPAIPENTTRIRADVFRARAQDFSIGFGYLFPFFTYFFPVYQDIHVGPVGGWSLNRQTFKIRDATTNGTSDSTLNNLRYTNLWQGPWLGVDIVFKTVCFTVKTGFEYHWGQWKAKWTLAGSDTSTAFSDRRHSHCVHNQVFYAKALWDFWCGWNAGLGFKILRFKARHGHLKPKAGSFAAIGSSSLEVDRVKHAIWESAVGTVEIGYSF